MFFLKRKEEHPMAKLVSFAIEFDDGSRIAVTYVRGWGWYFDPPLSNEDATKRKKLLEVGNILSAIVADRIEENRGELWEQLSLPL